MFTRLGLRLRIFLFFCLLAGGAIALAGGALFFGWSRGADTLPTAPFVTAFLIFAFVNTGLAVAVWLLFDEHVAKPIQTLAADLRLRAHSGVERPVDAKVARYLGDLAPAANAVSETLSTSVLDTAVKVARETERLKDESERLTALLTETPVATILLNPAQEIVLYDGQAADVLSTIAQPRLKAPLADYFDPAPLDQAIQTLSEQVSEAACILCDPAGLHKFDARVKSLAGDGHVLMIDAKSDPLQPAASRPLVFDFDLIDPGERTAIKDTDLRDLCFVVFDTETTGLSVETDSIVQIGAVRILNGRIVEGEIVETYVNPGCPIPPASTRVHQVTDDDVTSAPDIVRAGQDLHHFARDAVLVAHNAPFDIGLLRKSQSQMGVLWNHPVLDTVLLSAVIFGTTETHTLDALCDRLSVTIPPHLRHTALGDALATAQALVKLIPILEGQGFTTFGSVVDATRKHSRLLHDLN